MGTVETSALNPMPQSPMMIALMRAEAFVAEYTFESDEGGHTPTDLERLVMLDMLNGLFDDEQFVTALGGIEAHCCFICAQAFKAGEMVLSDVTEGLGHRACFGEDRANYVNLETGGPIGPDESIPAGEPYDPADYPEYHAATPAPVSEAAAPDYDAIAHEFHRLSLVIESAVRLSDPANHAEVLALIRANRVAISKAAGASS